MSDVIKTVRRAQNVSLATLAIRLGTSESAVSQLEKSEREGRIKLSSFTRALEALGHSALVSVAPTAPTVDYAPARISSEISARLAAGEEALALRLLTFAVREARDGSMGLDELAAPPLPLPRPEWTEFLKALYRRELGAAAPSWARPRALPQPTYLLSDPYYRQRADRDTPSDLRQLNLLIDERSFQRA